MCRGPAGAARFWNKNFLDYHPTHGFSDRLSIADCYGRGGLPVEKRDIFLQRIAAMLALRGYGRFTNTDVADVAQLALAGLVQKTADAA